MRLFFISSACILAALPAQAQNCQEVPDQTIKATINKSFTDLAGAVKSLDSDKYFSFFDKDRYTALNSDGTVTHSFDVFQNSFNQQFQYIKAYNELNFQNVKITVLDCKTAVLVNEYSAKITLQSNQSITAEGAGTQIWSKAKGDWKLVHVASSQKPAK
ncbi:nuclear transport factor 2 family protein [Kordiimonas sp. SCSIO 12610]|uniref:nuclear transport factor 2 family protein n=1 Tax=Kordiimonas sp. SCSIO 12610 TaxID=2829597 RepID=UPI002109569B|nr:nuclear transport factor 2 family protein [Kordiimonas sp. SCSIO 12610]UTW54566.1 nuclear transport factor 2 family protein [Kordiimonas sp. SCSIO 12610]